MRISLPIMALAMLLFACNQAPKEAVKEEASIAANSAWATGHLKGMVKTIEETSFTPDNEGKIGKMDSCCIEMTVFNDAGFVESYSEKNSDGKLTKDRKIKRTKDNKFKSAAEYKDGEKKWQRVTTYDDNGKILHAIDSDSTGQATYYYSEVTENELGQALKGQMHTADSVYMGTWSRKYIDGMRAGRGWVDSTGTELVNRTGEVNDMGLISKMTDYRMTDEGPTTKVYTYTYDSFDETGNWTQRTKHEDGKAIKVEKRAYTYYKK